ncbi:MAG TPA: hypothetical protein VM871_02625, partial [Flavisolibacter sp.]|nr:hypothetical protein [Flavisolibacter sp.]
FSAIFCSLSLCTIGLNISSCSKEYSYEREQQDSSVVKDSLPGAPPFLSSCSGCAIGNAIPDSSWQFTVDGSTLCGLADKAIITLERSSFTFFGPSSCSSDSGFIASVYLNESLNKNLKNVSAARVSFYYYDRLTPSYVLMSRSSDAFSLTIDSYVHQTGLAIGTFAGFAYTVNGIRKTIKEGKFKIKFF